MKESDIRETDLSCAANCARGDGCGVEAVEERRSKSVRADSRVSWHVSLDLEELLPAINGDASFTSPKNVPATFDAKKVGPNCRVVRWNGGSAHLGRREKTMR